MSQACKGLLMPHAALAGTFGLATFNAHARS